MNCIECDIELITDGSDLDESSRYGGLCADCFAEFATVERI